MKIKNVQSARLLVLSGAIASMIAVGCNTTDNDSKDQDSQDPKTNIEDKDASSTRIIPAGNKVFSIPSPLQLALLIKETGSEYDMTLLHDIKKVESYADETKMALNMGVYGADLGYTAIYQKPTDAIGFMKSVKKLTDKLQIAEAFNAEIIQNIESALNNEDKDVLLTTISNAYKDADIYLKDNRRENVSALILTGGWIESLYFATRVSVSDQNEQVRGRIGEQKKALDNILNILVRYFREPGVEEVYNELEDLYNIFNEVKISYSYEKPEVDVENRHTTIKSKTNVEYSAETFNAISEKVVAIRTIITQ